MLQDPILNRSQLKKFCQNLGADLFGVADISKVKQEFLLPKRISVKYDRAICLGSILSPGVLEEIECIPTKLYFHHYRTVNIFLDQLALRVANYIQKNGFLSIAIPVSQILDWEKQSAHLSHKKVGFLAGLGWLGKNNLLVNKKYGCQLRLVTILTDLPLKSDKSVKENCGSCRICIEVCPSGAIKDNPGDFDHARCFEKLKEFQRQKLVDQYICGICVKACRGRDGMLE